MQGTLYGRDSTGDSIHLHSKLPGNEFAANVSAQVGSMDRKDVMLSVDIPLTDNLLTKWSLGSYDQDAWVKSLTTGENQGWIDSEVLRGDILWTPLETVSLRLIHQEDNQVARKRAYSRGSIFGMRISTAIKWVSPRRTTSPNRFFLEQTTLHIDWDIPEDIHMKYMYGKSLSDTSVYNDWGGSEYNFFVNYYIDVLNPDSHEFQFTGSLFDDKVDWVAGYYTWDQTQRSRTLNGRWPTGRRRPTWARSRR